MKQAIRFVIILGSICLIMGSGVAIIYAGFKDEIARKERLQFESLLLQVLPTGEGFSAPEPLPNAGDVFVVKDSAGKPAAYAAEGAAQGYSSKVRVLVGAGADQEWTIRNVVVISQQETGQHQRDPEPVDALAEDRPRAGPVGRRRDRRAVQQIPRPV
jgi:electron transport complex protein RnfG